MVLWSTGFVVARYATDDTGPLTFLAVRMVIAAAILGFVVRRTSHAPRVERATRSRGSCSPAWACTSLYLGGVFVAIDRGLPAGVSALIAGLHPVITALAVDAGPRRAARSASQWIGVGARVRRRDRRGRRSTA